MQNRLPLSSLLSQALVAFTIEFDNEFEHRVRHRTSNYSSNRDSRDAPWLLSLAMWSMLLRFVPDDGITIRELQRLTRFDKEAMRMWLTRLSKWWRYLTVRPGPANHHSKRPNPDWVVSPTPGGLAALHVCRSLVGTIEQRWQTRFGQPKIMDTSTALSAFIEQFSLQLPACLPILKYGLYSKGTYSQAPAVQSSAYESTLPALLSKILFAFAIEFERESQVSLAISANVLRLVNETGVRSRDLPALAGVSEEAVATSLKFLEKRGFAAIEAKMIVLTPEGAQAKHLYHQLVWTIEERWRAKHSQLVTDVRQSLERLVVGPAGQPSPLFAALEPYPDGWRAAVPKPKTLPHFPMILHRGGFPDGS